MTLKNTPYPIPKGYREVRGNAIWFTGPVADDGARTKRIYNCAEAGREHEWNGPSLREAMQELIDNHSIDSAYIILAAIDRANEVTCKVCHQFRRFAE